MRYKGRFLTIEKILPIYTPKIPRTVIIMPLKKYKETIKLLQPETGEPTTSAFMSKNVPVTSETTDIKKPSLTDNKSGFSQFEIIASN